MNLPRNSDNTGQRLGPKPVDIDCCHTVAIADIATQLLDARKA